MANPPKTVTQYLASLPKDRSDALKTIRKTILANLDDKVTEGIQYGMMGYFLNHKVYPDGYHCDPKTPLPFLSVGSQKNHMALYLFCIYASEGEKERFANDWTKTGKKLDMGKSCVRFKKIEDVPLAVLGKTIKRMTVNKFIKSYEGALAQTAAGKKKVAAAKKATSKKASPKKKAAAKKSGTKKVTKKKVVAKKKATKKSVTKKATKKSKKK